MTNQAAFSTGLVVLAFGASLLASPVQAQKAEMTYRLGWLEVCGPGPQRLAIFRARLAELGYFEGKNLVIEQRFADCHYERMVPLATELTQLPVNALFTVGTRATRIVAAAVNSTPVVAYSCDPFVHVSKLARPGGNVTGVTCMTAELMPKRLEILKELVPTTMRVTFLQDPEASTNAFELTQEVAKRLGVELRLADVTAADELNLEPELAAITKDRPDGLLVYPDMVLSSPPRPRQLGDFAIKAGIPTMNPFRFFVDAGGLVSYGATATEIYRSAAEQVAKILGGTKPGELPLRQATKFEMVINNKTAKALGITVPATLLARADEVIE